MLAIELIGKLEKAIKEHGKDIQVYAMRSDEPHHYTANVDVTVTDLPHDLSITIEGV